ncbi:MAG: inorganic phosphate transporter [Chloroflexi bacterium]|nr:inorganic phosphate transporter [Chloroflexota bacterium]
MLESSQGLFVLVVALAVGFGVVNGWNDAANAIATVVGTRVLSPRNAVILATITNLAGAATGTAVAKTIGKGILLPEALTYPTVIAALLSIIMWGTFTTRYGLPISLTHGFVAGLAGAGIALFGTEAVVWSVMLKIILWVVIAPVLGFVIGFVFMICLSRIFRRTRPTRIRRVFSGLQTASAAFVAYAHGLNDGQMPVGIITAAMVIYTRRVDLWDNIPWWIIIASALAISFGTAIGGWRVIRTLGMRVTTLRPIHGFAAESTAASVIELASLWGIPISTTQCISSAIIGVGATRRFSAVRWNIARNIVTTWIATFPLCGGLGYLLALLFKSVL